MSAGSVKAKILRGASASHTSYGFQRSTTPPGKESSSSPADRPAAEVETEAAGSAGTGHSTKVGFGETLRDPGPTFFFQFSNELFDSLFLRQKAAPDCPLEPNRSKIRSHSSRLRRTLPSRNFRIPRFPSKREPVLRHKNRQGKNAGE